MSNVGRSPCVGICWYQQNDLVDAPLALRDHERVSYTCTGPRSAAVELNLDTPTPEGFTEFVAADLDRRRQSEQSPTPQGTPAA